MQRAGALAAPDRRAEEDDTAIVTAEAVRLQQSKLQRAVDHDATEAVTNEMDVAFADVVMGRHDQVRQHRLRGRFGAGDVGTSSAGLRG